MWTTMAYGAHPTKDSGGIPLRHCHVVVLGFEKEKIAVVAVSSNSWWW